MPGNGMSLKLSLSVLFISLSSNKYLGSSFFFLFSYTHHFPLLHKNNLFDIKPTISAFVYFSNYWGHFSA